MALSQQPVREPYWTRRRRHRHRPAPSIAGAGSPSPLRGYPVGSVVRVARAAAEEYYVILAQGVQRIGQLAADLIRFTDSQHDRDIATVAPDVIAAMPVVDSLRVSTFPRARRCIQRRRCVHTVAVQPDRNQNDCIRG